MGRWTSSLHARSGTFSLQNVRFRKRKIMLETYTRPRGRCFLVSIKKFKTCIFRRKFLATTICHLTTENFYPVASCRPYKKVTFGPWLVEHRAVTREVVSSTPAGPTLRVFKLLTTKYCFCNYICKWLDSLVLSDKDDKP